MSSSIDELFISIGVKADTKSLDDVLKKVGLLNSEVKDLNKNTKTVKLNGVNVSSAATNISQNATRREWEKDIKREEKINRRREQIKTNELKAEEKEAKIEEARAEKRDKEDEKARKAEEKQKATALKEEQKAAKLKQKEEQKEEKRREKAAKDFFKVLDQGFSGVAKGFLGFLGGTGIAGAVVQRATSHAMTLKNLQLQYGINPVRAQRLAHVFKQGSGISDEETYGAIAQITQLIKTGQISGGDLAGKLASAHLSAGNINEAEDIFFGARAAFKNDKFDPGIITSLLGALGVPGEISQSLNPQNLTDKEFKELYDKAPTLSEKELDAGKKVYQNFASLEDELTVISGKLLNIFGPDINNLLDTIIKKLEALTPKDIKETGDKIVNAGKGALYGNLFGLAAGAYLKNPALSRAGAIAGGYIGYNYSDKIADLINNPWITIKRTDGKSKISSKPKRSKEDAATIEGYKDAIRATALQPMSEREIDAKANRIFENSSPTINQTTNINTNIQADTLDYSSVPAITGGIIKGGKAASNQLNDTSRYLYSSGGQ